MSKPKSYTTSLNDVNELVLLKEAFNHLECYKAMKAEYVALLTNVTRTLILRL